MYIILDGQISLAYLLSDSGFVSAIRKEQVDGLRMRISTARSHVRNLGRLQVDKANPCTAVHQMNPKHMITQIARTDSFLKKGGKRKEERKEVQYIHLNHANPQRKLNPEAQANTFGS
jgi:hypothetical protein